jgi:hypothetical protein
MKFYSDKYFSNKYYAKVGGINLTEFNAQEEALLIDIDYMLYVDEFEYENYQDKIMTFYESVNLINQGPHGN